MVQVNNKIIILRFQLFHHQFPAVRQHMNFINIWVMFNHREEFILYQKMNFCICHLLL